MDNTSSETQSTAAAENSAPEVSVKKRVAQFDYYYDIRTHNYKLRKSVKQKGSDHSKYALLLRRQIDEKGRYRGTTIDIKSTALRDVLIDINKDVEDIGLVRNVASVSEHVMYYSYPALRHRLELEVVKEERDETLILDIRAGIFCVEEYQGTLLKDVEKMLSQKQISWDTAWVLFRPNCLVYSFDTPTGQDVVLKVVSNDYETRENQTQYLAVVCKIITDDGEDFGYAMRVLEIDKYEGTRAVTSLPTYPIDFHADSAAVYAQAVELGKQFVRMPRHSYHELTGQAIRSVRVPESFEEEESVRNEPFLVNGRVMISPSMYRRFMFGRNIYNPDVPRPNSVLPKEGLTDDQYAICTPIVLGFAFDRKAWGGFPLRLLQNVVWDEAAFDSLVLGDRQKKVIHTLVRQHAKVPGGFDDIIKGKGRGLIGLLAGGPGCGKTLTAEAIAEVTHKPLYTLSAGELGIGPGDLESKLLEVLELTHAWDAVLLLDEAEVFLTQRHVNDLNRNALVSIFLRHLEYLEGILLLTTNMPEECDRAFESRIHFSISYPDLDVEARKTIWSTFFKKNAINHVPEDALSRLASHQINGRQIRNIFSSALTISRANGTELLEDIDVVLEVLHDWENAKHGLLGTSTAATTSVVTPAADLLGDFN